MGPSLSWDRGKEPFPGGIVSFWGYGRLDYMHLGCSWAPRERLAVTSGDGAAGSVAVLPTCCQPNTKRGPGLPKSLPAPSRLPSIPECGGQGLWKVLRFLVRGRQAG